MRLEGLITGIATLAIIALFHPLVVKGEYYFTKRIWVIFLAVGVAVLIKSFFTLTALSSGILGVLAVTCFWSILELFEQEERVLKGYSPKNPNRKYE